jgi:quercetin dioxygenase-like cupin family protein
MRTENLMQDWEFNDKDQDPRAQGLYVTHDSRILRFALRPGQSIPDFDSPHSPQYIVVLSGQGIFSGAGGREQTLGPNSLVVFEAGENHSIRAMNEDLVFISFEHGVSGRRPENR